MKDRGDPESWGIPIAFLKENMDLERASVLDIGFGVGGFLLALAKESMRVTGVDISSNVIKNMEARSEYKKMDNIRLLCESAVNLPFDENSFDLIILNGVLEYTAREQEGAPRETHLKVLMHIRRLLRSGGLLYLGIENRYYLKFLLGARDHYEMRWSNVLPRNLSTFISRLIGQEVRHWVYSYDELIELLKEAGFNESIFFTALPNYKPPEYIIPISDLNAIQEASLKINTKRPYQYVCYIIAYSGWLYRKIGPDFIVLSRVRS